MNEKKINNYIASMYFRIVDIEMMSSFKITICLKDFLFKIKKVEIEYGDDVSISSTDFFIIKNIIENKIKDFLKKGNGIYSLTIMIV